MTKKTKEIYVSKASGDSVPFSSEKLRSSLLRSGAGEDIADYVIGKVEEELYEGISTKKIYQKAFKILRSEKERPLAARYKLKQAIMELGPSGFPFEKFVAELFKAQGYQVKTGQIMPGICVKHEIDVIAEKEGEHLLIECKFHNNSGYYSNVKVPLYIHSRFSDIHKRLEKIPENNLINFSGWVVTNTKFTGDAIQYGVCIGLHLLGWDFPREKNLRDLIDEQRLYPITSLLSLSKHEKNLLLDKDIVLCKSLMENEKMLKNIGLTNTTKVQQVLTECYKICNGGFYE